MFDIKSLIWCGALLASLVNAEEGKMPPKDSELPTLEAVEIYATKVARGKYEYTLDFAACRETTEADWNFEYKVVETAPGIKYALITLRPKVPLDCKSPFRSGTAAALKGSIPLKQYPELTGVLHYIVQNPSELQVTYDDE